MADTSIEWTNKVWNFLAGCSLTSPGCTNCYAMTQAARIERMNPALAHYQGLTKASKAGPVWTGKVAYAGDAKLTEPLRVRKPQKWFVNSMSDLFHEDVPDEVIDKAFAVMALAPQHTFQVLTKRSKRMREYMTGWDLPHASAWDRITSVAHRIGYTVRGYRGHAGLVQRPLPNVWLGVSVERQQEADERIPDLLATPAAIRWISAEPLLGPVDLDEVAIPRPDLRASFIWSALRGCGGAPAKLDWVVAGGESGRGARPLHPDWARSLRDQCAAAGVPFFFKQWGEFYPEDQPVACGHEDHDPDRVDTSTGELMFRVGKARAGRLLDGVEHNAFPENRP